MQVARGIDQHTRFERKSSRLAGPAIGYGLAIEQLSRSVAVGHDKVHTLFKRIACQRIIFFAELVSAVYQRHAAVVAHQLVIEVRAHKAGLAHQPVGVDIAGVLELRISQVLNGQIAGAYALVHVNPCQRVIHPTYIGGVGARFGNGVDAAARVCKQRFVCKRCQHLLVEAAITQTVVNIRNERLRQTRRLSTRLQRVLRLSGLVFTKSSLQLLATSITDAATHTLLIYILMFLMVVMFMFTVLRT